MTKNKLNYLYLLPSLLVLLLSSACRKEYVVTPGAGFEAICPSVELQMSHLILGNPSNATSDVNEPDNYLITLPEYQLSYHRDRGIPNWVAWHLSADWFGNAPRQNDYRVFTKLPDNWFFATHSDYTNTGFNRGHSCPSGDRKCSISSNSNTFFMVNILPQSPNHNQGPWRVLEEYCRDLVDEGKELYIVMGNYGEGGIGENGYETSIASGAITVPESIWKIIVVLEDGEDDLNRVDNLTRVIAVDIPNEESVIGLKWGDFRVSVDDIEAATNWDFLSNLPLALQEELETMVDDGETQ